MKSQFSRRVILAALTILLVVPVFVFTASYSSAAENIIDGDLVKTADNPDVYIVKLVGVKKFKRLILNPDIFNSYGHLRWDKIKTVDQGTVDAFTPSELVIEVNADGSVADPKVYRVASAAGGDVGERRWLNITAAEFEAAGYDWDSLYKVNHREAAPDFYPTKAVLTYQEVLAIKKVALSPTNTFSITLVAPNKILAGYPTNIVIKGTGFQQGAKVDFGSGATQVVYSVTNSEQISALIPASMPALTYNLAITNPDGQIVILNNALTLQAAPTSTISALTTSQIFDLVSSSVVQIGCGNGVGSGFAFESNGHILTNQHVVEGCNVVEVKLKDNTILQGNVLGVDAVNDVAVVKVTQNLPVLILGNSDEPALPLGSNIFVLGHPIGLSNAVITKGLLTSRQRFGLNFDHLTTDASTEGGSSGGPWVNEKGEVIGLHQAALKNSAGTISSVKISIPINFIKGITSSLKSGAYTPVSTPTPTPTTPPTPTVQPLTTAVNFSFSGSTSSSPTGVKGATSAKIASFVITAGSGEGVDVSQIVVKNSATAGLALGHDFQNLTLKNGSAQIGTTVGSLSTTASNTHTFNPSPAISINAGQQYIVDVYADILTNAVNITTAPYTAVILDSVTGTGKSTNTDSSSAVDRNGQNVYIADTGSLAISAASDMPIAQNRSMGKTGQTLATFKLTTGSSEAVNISSIVVTDTLAGVTSGAIGSVTNLSLWNSAGVQVGSTVASIVSVGANASATFSGLAFNITKDKSEVLTLKGDINTYPNAVSGSTHTFSIAENSAVTVVGATSGQAIAMTGAPVIGNAQRIYRSELTVTNAMSNFSGGASADQSVGKYRFTNTSVGNNTITISDIDLGISTSIAGSSTATRYITLKRDSVGGTVIAKKGFKTSFTDITNWISSAGDPNEVSFQSFTIDATSGTGYVDVYIIADTNDASAVKSLSTSLGSGSNVITWSDGISSNITTLDSAPIVGSTVTY